MANTRKRLLSLVLSLVMALGLLPIQAWASELTAPEAVQAQDVYTLLGGTEASYDSTLGAIRTLLGADTLEVRGQDGLTVIPAAEDAVIRAYPASFSLVTYEEAPEPEATEPEATEPEATEPEAPEPEATEPEVTEPEVTEPEATEPEDLTVITGSEVSQSAPPAEVETPVTLWAAYPLAPALAPANSTETRAYGDQVYAVEVGGTISVKGDTGYLWDNWYISSGSQYIDFQGGTNRSNVTVIGVAPGIAKIVHEGMMSSETFTIQVMAAGPKITYVSNWDGSAGIEGERTRTSTETTVLGANTFSPPAQYDASGVNVFAGWNTEWNGSGTSYQPGQSITIPEEGVTLYAQWNRWVKFFVFNGSQTPGENVSTAAGNYYPNGTDNGGVSGATVDTGFTEGYLTQTGYAALKSSTQSDENGTRMLFNTTKDALNGYLITTELDLGNYANIDNGSKSVSWYVIKEQGDGIHCDGYVTNNPIDIVYHPNFQGATGSYTQKALSGQLVSILSYDATGLPTQTGWSFRGWSTSQTGDVKYNVGEDVTFTGGQNLYAVWARDQVTIEYKVAGSTGGTVSLPSESVDVGGDAVGSTANPSTGYYFVGWYSDESCTGTPVSTELTWAPTNVTASATYYAKFAEKETLTIQITGSSATETYSGSVQSVAGFTVNTALPTGVSVDLKDGVTAAASGTDVGVYEMNLTEGSFEVTAPAGYDVILHVTDGTLTITKRNVTLTSASDSKPYDGTALTNGQVTVGGDGFAEGEGAEYTVTGAQTTVGSSKNTFTYTLKEGTLASNYNITEVEGTLEVLGKVTYDANGGDVNSVPTDNNTYELYATVTADKTVTPTRENYTFAGWMLSADGTETVNEGTMGATGLTFYAKWTRNTYTVKVEYKISSDGSRLAAFPDRYLPEGLATTFTVSAGESWKVAVGTGTGDYVAPAALRMTQSTYAFDPYITPGPMEGDGDDLVVTLVYGTDTKGGQPDGIPDYYQKTVTYKVVNGAWDDGGRMDKSQLVTLTDAEGNWSTTGSYFLKASDIPALGAANPGYEADQWYKGKYSGEPVGSSIEGDEITEDTTYTFKFKVRQFTLTVVDEYVGGPDAGEVTRSTELKDYRAIISLDKLSNVKKGYVFDTVTVDGGSLTVNNSSVTGRMPTEDVVVTFTYKPINSYVEVEHRYVGGPMDTDPTMPANFDDDGVLSTQFQVDERQYYDYGEELNAFSALTEEDLATGYVFSEYGVHVWNDDADTIVFNGETNSLAGTMPEGPVNIVFYYAPRTDLTYTVKYLEEGTNVQLAEPKTVSNITYGETVTEVAVPIPHYAVSGAGEQTVLIDAENKEIIFYYTRNSYTVTWVDYDGTVLEKDEGVPYGDTPSYDSATPSRPSDLYYVYTFTGWTPEVEPVTGDAVYTATYTATYVPPYIPPVNPPVDPGTDIDDENVPLADLPGLNTVDHYAYIVGYEDGTVRPNGNITRAEVATIFFRLFTDEYRATFWATTNSFSDVTVGAWFNNAVSTTANAGIVNGYPDGSFKPNNKITRAEFAAIAARFLSEEYVGPDLFTDISGHWAAEYINRAANAGWINGYPDGSFHPDAYITRAEAMTLVNNMLGRAPHRDHMLEDMVKWPDNPETAWYYEAVQEATNGHDYDWVVEEDVKLYEIWLALQENRDWAALETEWANAYSAPGGQVMGN